MRTKRYNEWLREGFEFKPDSSGDYRYAGHDLTSLKGAPESVGGNFYCGRNMLMSLEGAPESVGGDFYCSSNSLMTLVGAPESVSRDFSCSSNRLTTLEGAPESVGWNFYCDSNMLTTLEGAPEKIGGNFSCDEFTIDRGKWGVEGWLEVLQTGTAKAKTLILTLLSDDLLDKYFTEHPTELYVLDGHPDLKAGVLKRTGIRDMSRLGRNLKNKLI